MDDVVKAIRRHNRREYFRMFPDDRKRSGLLKALWIFIRGQWKLTLNSPRVARARLALGSLISKLQGRQVEITDDIEL